MNPHDRNAYAARRAADRKTAREEYRIAAILLLSLCAILLDWYKLF